MMRQINPDTVFEEYMQMEDDEGTVRNFDHTYALIYCNEDYTELSKIMEMANLKWTMKDLENAKSTYQMMQIKPDNVFELINASWDKIKAVDEKLAVKLAAHALAGETVMIYAYMAGHGCADGTQYFIINESDASKVLYNIEEQLRMRSTGNCFVVAIYDICRLQRDAEKIKVLMDKQKAINLQIL